MSDKEYVIELDPLAVGLTRSAVYMGVDMRFFMGNIVLGCLICLYTKSLYGIVFSLIFYLVLRQISKKEPEFFSLYCAFYRTSMPLITSGYWGGTNSYQPW